jgi:hypothetical protein
MLESFLEGLSVCFSLIIGITYEWIEEQSKIKDAVAVAVFLGLERQIRTSVQHYLKTARHLET